MAEERVSRKVYEQLIKNGLCNKTYEDWKKELIKHGPYATAGNPETAIATGCIGTVGTTGPGVKSIIIPKEMKSIEQLYKEQRTKR